MKNAPTKKPAVSLQGADAAERKKALDIAIKQLEKDFGAGTIMRLGQNSHMEVQAVHTGSLTLDMALGIGGVPRGRITEIFGPESSGKTTVALHIVAEVQKTGGQAAFIDAEHALDPVYAKALGVDIDNLLVSQPDCGEEALDITEALVRSGAVDVVVIDSVAALVPRQEIEGDMGQSQVGVQARLMSQAMRKLSAVISKSNAVVIFINQLREKVGVMYGNPETTTGGRALKFYASVRIDVRKTEQLKNGNDIYGNHVKCKIVKNKVAPPFRVAEFDVFYGKGISRAGELVDIGLLLDVIQKSGSWFSYNGERLGQGKDNIRKMLETNRPLFEEIEGKIRTLYDKMEPGEASFDLDDGDEEEDFDLRALKMDDAQKPEQVRLYALHAADGGARLILRLECMGEAGTVREDLTVFAARLDRTPQVGELSLEDYDFFCREAELCEAVGIGMRSLGAGLESRARLLQKLRVRGVSPEVAREATEELARRGFLDELGGAVREAERGMAKYWGDRRILADIRAKGYPPAACRAAQKRLAEEDCVARLVAFLRRRHIARPREEREAARLFAALARYGYTAGDIRRALEVMEK